MAGQRTLGLNAIRSNPYVVAHSITGTVDQGMTGEGLFTTFRELKPGTVDAVFDGWAPLRWCLFAEPGNVYRKTPVRLEAVLANEDVLAPGEYPVRLQVIGPKQTRVLDRTITVQVPERTGSREPPFALPVFARRRGDRRAIGQVPLRGDVRKGSGGRRRRGCVLRGRSAGNAEGRRQDRDVGTGRRTGQEACGTRHRCLAI